MKDPLGVRPSNGNQGTTRGKENILLSSVGIEPTTYGLDLPLRCRNSAICTVTLSSVTYPGVSQSILNNVTKINESVIYVSYTVVTICPGASGMRFSCAIQMALTPSYKAVPSMLTVAPKGRTKRLMRRSMPFFSSRQRMVVGKVAELKGTI